jgi:hypothetical protein
MFRSRFFFVFVAGMATIPRNSSKRGGDLEKQKPKTADKMAFFRQSGQF